MAKGDYNTGNVKGTMPSKEMVGATKTKTRKKRGRPKKRGCPLPLQKGDVYKIFDDIDPRVAVPWDINQIVSEIPEEALGLLQENGKPFISDVSKRDPVANLPWPFMKFSNAHLFSPAAEEFKKNRDDGYPAYTLEMEGTPAYDKFWIEERRRCEEGYFVGGLFIPPPYYYFLNYCPINRIIEDDKGNVIDDRKEFPKFLSMQYYFFLEFWLGFTGLAEEGKYNTLLDKSRRKGMSFAAAALATWLYNIFVGRKIILAAEEGIKARRTFEKMKVMIDFVNEHTEFRSGVLIDKASETRCHIKCGRKEKINGVYIDKGRLSEIITVSVKDKNDAAAGEGCHLVIFEEIGMMKDPGGVWAFTKDTLKSGAYWRGVCLAFGTGGDVEKAAKEFGKMFYNPAAKSFKSYDNIYEETITPGNQSGYFMCDMWFREQAFYIDLTGKKWEAIDKDGNPIFWVAEVDMMREREKLSKGEKREYILEKTQRCRTPAESFMRITGSFFPTEDLMERLLYMNARAQVAKPYTYGYLEEAMGKIRFKSTAGLQSYPEPLMEFPIGSNVVDFTGSVVQYYPPQSLDKLGNTPPPPGAYVIGYDTWGIDKELVDKKGRASLGQNSLGAVYVLRTRKYFNEIPHANRIVATFVGRTADSSKFNETVLKLAKYYNAKVNFENDRGEVRPYFTRRRALHYLQPSPFMIFEKNNMKANLGRKFGYSMSNRRFKLIALEYLNNWLIEPRVEDAGLRNLDFIEDIPLLQELVSFDIDNGNFDRVMGFLGCVLAQEEDTVIDEVMAPLDNEDDFEFLLNNKLFIR